QHDYSVLPGFVLSNSLLRQFLTNSDNFQSLMRELSDSSFNLDVDDYIALQSVAHRSRHIINQISFSSELELKIFQAAQQLNSDCLILQPFFSLPSGQDLVGKEFWRSHTCKTHPQALTQTIKKIWSELFSASSLIYRNSLGIGGKTINLNILVRPLKNAVASGIVEITADIIRIKAVWGQDRSLLQGEVESDEYYLDRHTGRILSRNLGHKNYGYRIRNDRTEALVGCLEAYLPHENQTEAYVLESKAIAQLFQFTQEILQKQPQIEYFLWTAPATEADSPLDFLITQYGEHLLTSIDLFSQHTTPVLLPSTTVKPLLTGIPAASGKEVAEVVVIEDPNTPLDSITANSILVIKNIVSKHISALANARGIITETGGKTSHGAIVARELNIPAIVHAVGATNILTNGTKVFLDGGAGKVYPAKAAQELPPINLSTGSSLNRNQLIATKLMVNISQPQSIPLSLNLPIDGVGLLRSELMLAQILADKSPAQWQSQSFQTEFTHSLKKYLEQFLSAFAPRPVFYRSLDWSSQEAPNFILGNRGTYSSFIDSTLFSLELNALSAIAAAGHRNFNLILPFVRSVEEFKFCYHLLEKSGLTNRESFQVWIMAEVPSVIWLLPEYIKAGVQGIAIGTNDLTQLLLGVDREQAHFSQHGLNASHPVVQKAIAQLITVAREHNIDSCICGQGVVEYPDLIDKLVRWGITSISVEPKAVPQTYKAIARAERRILLNSLNFP
ncbi:MAG: putative PEP-binding protein, partial [Pleurocapsa sp.]